MKDDPIVEEVHRTRARLLAEHDGSLDKYAESLKRREAEEGSEKPIRSLEEFRRRTLKMAS